MSDSMKDVHDGMERIVGHALEWKARALRAEAEAAAGPPQRKASSTRASRDLARAFNALRELELSITTQADRERAARIHLWLVASEDLRATVTDLRKRVRLARAQIGAPHHSGDACPQCLVLRYLDLRRRPLQKGKRR